MRAFTPAEKKLIEKFVKLKFSSDNKEIEIARLLKNELNVLAIELHENNDYIKLYWTRDDEGSEQERDFRQFFKLVDLLDFIRLLEEKRYIYVSRLKNTNKDGSSILYYDHKNYGYTPDEKLGYKFYRKIGEGIIGYSYMDSSQLNTDVADLFNKYGNGIICPLQSLEDLHSHSCKSIEQRQFNKTQFTMWAAIIVSIFLGLFPHYCKRTETKAKPKEEVVQTYKLDTLKAAQPAKYINPNEQ